MFGGADSENSDAGRRLAQWSNRDHRCIGSSGHRVIGSSGHRKKPARCDLLLQFLPSSLTRVNTGEISREECGRNWNSSLNRVRLLKKKSGAFAVALTDCQLPLANR
jgi:hypothetical protein